MIDHGTIERVMETANSQIVEVVSEFVSLRKRGVNYLGNCPFHNEKTPSFTVSPHKGIFKCFGCGKGGNAVNFLMEHDQISFVEAIKFLGSKFHIHIEEEEMTADQLRQKSERESMLVLSEFASKYFIDQLQRTDEGKSVGLGYFRKREFRDDIISKFQLGYSPEKRDALTVEARNQGYRLEYLEKTGLSVVRDDYKADRFRGRVIFPIHSLAGKVIGFGGRILKSDAKAAKYLNSPESEIYHKSRVLYGLFQAKQEMSRLDRCYLVEGYTEVLYFQQAGIPNVVASSGTALTTDQIRLISRFTKNVSVIYDGDSAGIKASIRGIDLILAEGLNVKVLLLPDGEDPDSFARKMPGEALKEYIAKNESDFVKFKTKLLLEEAQNDPIKRAQLIQDIIRTIAVIPEPITRSVYIKECSILLQVDEPMLYDEISKLKQKKLESVPPRGRQADSASVQAPGSGYISTFGGNNFLDLEERVVLRYLVKFGDFILLNEPHGEAQQSVTVGEYIIRELRQDDLVSANPLYNKAIELYEKAEVDESFTALKFFVNNQDTEISQLASDLLGKEYELSKMHAKYGKMKSEEDLLGEHVPKVMAELKLKKVKLILDEKGMELQEVEKTGDQVAFTNIMMEIAKWTKFKNEISLALGSRSIG